MLTADDWTVFFTAAGLVPLAYAATNLDNLLIMATLAAGSTERRGVVIGFLAASAVVLAISSTAIVIDYFVPDELIGYLGFVPLSFGVYILLTSGSPDSGRTARQATWPAIAGLMLANSTDTMFALGPLFAESGNSARIGLVVGFVLAACIWLILILSMSSKVAQSRTLSRLGHRLAPWMMILIGLYILSDTATDLV